MTTKRFKESLYILILIPVASVVLADGFRNPPDGALAIGRFGGKIAQIDDPSAVTLNPANMTRIQSPSSEVSATMAIGQKEFTDQRGMKAETDNDMSVLPSAYYVWPLKTGGAVAGIGVNSPFGRSTTYDENSILRYNTPYFSELRTAKFTPAIALPLGKTVSVGIGADMMYSDFTLKQIFPWGFATGNPLAPDGKAVFEGDGVGFGGNAAITWQPAEAHSLAVIYRSSIKVDYSGDLTVGNVPPAAARPGPLSLASPKSDFETDITFPAVVGFGYGWQATKRLRLEADAEWTQHSSFDELNLDIGNNAVLLPSTTIPADWKDAWSYGVGADYALNDTWTLRGGYFYVETPIPSRTLTPSIAEEDQGVVSVGLGYEKGVHHVDVAYAYGLFNGRKVSDNVVPAYNGDYDFDSHLFAMSYVRDF